MSVTIQIKGTETTFDIPTDIPATLEGEQIITLVHNSWWKFFDKESGEINTNSVEQAKIAREFIRKYADMRGISSDMLPNISTSNVVEILRRCQDFFGE